MKKNNFADQASLLMFCQLVPEEGLFGQPKYSDLSAGSLSLSNWHLKVNKMEERKIQAFSKRSPKKSYYLPKAVIRTFRALALRQSEALRSDALALRQSEALSSVSPSNSL